MIYRLLADFVLILHFLFIGFVIFGGLLVSRYFRIVWIHIAAACWGTFIELNGGVCPLTLIEVKLRRIAGDSGYSDSFIEHYLLPVIYPLGLTRDIQLWLAGLVVLINVVVYGALVYRWRISRSISSRRAR